MRGKAHNKERHYDSGVQAEADQKYRVFEGGMDYFRHFSENSKHFGHP